MKSTSSNHNQGSPTLVQNGSTCNLRTRKRRLVVWACFAGAMTGASGMLLLGDSGAPTPLPALRPEFVGGADGSTGAPKASAILPRESQLVAGQWNAIVIHHSATLAGDASTLERQHLASGLSGLGYHFVIGNGQGLGDGVVQVGYRWNRQLPGAHVAAGGSGTRPGDLKRTSLSPRDADQFNRHSIGICLIGNGNRREFTDRQVRELIGVVRELQAQLGIPGSSVYLHSDLAQLDSPGHYFPTAEFEAGIRR